MKKFFKHFILFFIFGCIYIVTELVYRGYSHWSMFILGGICGVLIGVFNEIFSWNTPMWKQAGIGASIITFLEFVCGVIVNIWLKWDVWDYSNVSFNIMGQICLPFIFIWFILAHIAIVFDDYLRYWLFKEQKPKYKYF